MTRVKVCGITNVDDARLAVECGADALGVNLIPTSARVVDHATARRIVQAVGGRATVVGVVADLPPREMERTRHDACLDLLQLHGHEPPEWLLAVLPLAYKALRVGAPEDVAEASHYAGDRILVDAKVSGRLGGTGVTFDWSLVRQLASERRLVLAGGLTPDNVCHAVTEVRPWGVDVATGVEAVDDPRRKDPEKLRRFVEQVRASG